MPIYHKENEKNIFHIHIPKTGGSSITKIFELNGWKQNLFGSIKRGQQHILRNQWNSSICKIKFTVTRNPIDRIKSEIRGNSLYINKNTFNVNNSVKELMELKLSGNTKANHLNANSDFFNKEDNVIVFKFEDPNHRNKIKELFKLEGKFPHIVGDTYEPFLDYELSKESENLIKKIYKKDYERFYPHLL